MRRNVIVSVCLPDVMRVIGSVVCEMLRRSWPLRALMEIWCLSGEMGICFLASPKSIILPSAPESSNALVSCMQVAHLSLTRKRVDDGDEVFLGGDPTR